MHFYSSIVDVVNVVTFITNIHKIYSVAYIFSDSISIVYQNNNSINVYAQLF